MRRKPRKPKDVQVRRQADAASRDRESVLSDFRKIAGPLRGRNQDPRAKP